MSLYVDKYRPKTLDALDYHHGVSARLKALASSSDFPHLLVYGPSGAGKKTRILATLHELFGPGVEKMKIDVRNFVTPTNRKLEFNIVSSAYHLEITPSDMGNNDRVVIQDLLKEVAQTESVDFATSGSHRFKVVIINEADQLSRDAQAALRRTMEKYSSNIRLILISNTTSNIIAPIKSRTLLIRIPAPEKKEIKDILIKLINSEQIPLNSESIDGQELLDKIVGISGRNLRKAYLLFEAVVMQSDTLNGSTPVPKPDWEEVISMLAQSIKAERTVSRIAQSRSTLYELISHCIPPRTILKTLAFELINRVQGDLKLEIISLAAEYDNRLSLGSKAIFHLEAFVIKVMATIEKDAIAN